MSIEDLLKRKPETLRCPAGHDHATVPVWASVQQQGMLQQKHLPTFHCENHDIRGRKENWRSYPVMFAIEQGHLLTGGS